MYLVRHKQTKMRFAMKRLSKQRMIMKKQVQNIFQERDVLTVAENPFVVGLWCSFQTEVQKCYVFSYSISVFQLANYIWMFNNCISNSVIVLVIQ